MSSTVQAFTVAPTGAALGARVTGINLEEPIAPEVGAGIRAAFLKHSVLLFPEQTLSKKKQVGFSRLFGQPVPHPTNTRDRDAEVPEITIISNVFEDGEAVGALGNAELNFHADLVFLHIPGSVSVLHCLETPDHGGDTYWSSGYAAHDALSREMVARIQGLSVVYIHRTPSYNPDPPARHPLLCRHPESKRDFLFVSPSSADSIPGMPDGKSRVLLDELLVHATEERFVWRHSWRSGDVVVWDNRSTLHRRDGFDANQRRIMHRTQMLGSVTESGV